jgi:endoglucanase
VIAVTTVQEEVGLRGAITGSDKIEPSIAVVIDVTHAQTMDTKNQVSINLDKGPAIPVGPNIHPEVLAKMIKTAEENRIPYQIQPIAGPTGTDARVIQLAGHGTPTGLISIPLRYMHTSVETASLKDITNCGKLLAYFIASLPEDLEELSCS